MLLHSNEENRKSRDEDEKKLTLDTTTKQAKFALHPKNNSNELNQIIQE